MIEAVRNAKASIWMTCMIAIAMAFIPAAAEANVIQIELCSADGEVRTVSIPVEQDDGENHCAKPCHACLTRKKAGNTSRTV